MIELALNEVQKYFGAVKVLENITFEVHTNDKVGIIGRNGTGKTTIMKIIAGIERPDKGTVAIRKGRVVGYLDQIPDFPAQYSVLDVLNIAFEKQHKIKEDMTRLEYDMSSRKGSELDIAVKRYGELQYFFEHCGGYEIDEKMSKICIGLKINGEFERRIFSTLSGGEKTTVMLGKILLQDPDILLLDEPSNHLDTESLEWLEEFLSEYKGTVLIVSHDRYFLDKVVTKIVEVEDMETDTYSGNYSAYVKEKETRLMLQFDAYEDQQKKIKAMEKAIKDLRDWGLRADNAKFFKRAESMQKRLDKIQKIDKPILERPGMKLDFEGSDRSGKDVIRVESLTKAFDNKIILDKVNLCVRYGEKVALIGTNGSGKSTLIKILLKEYAAGSGTAELGSGVMLGYLPQNVIFEKEEQTVLECFRENVIITEGKAREYLAKFMFYGDNVFKKVKNLSGGEKSRLKLCQLMFEDINLLILDEPTNHLDIDSRENLEKALKEFDGTVLFISHDRFFINMLCDYIVEVRDKALMSYPGNYEYYKEKRNERKLLNSCAKDNPKPVNIKKTCIHTKPTVDKKRDGMQVNFEEKIQDIEALIKKVDIDMTECVSDFERLNELYMERNKLQQELDELLVKWLNI